MIMKHFKDFELNQLRVHREYKNFISFIRNINILPPQLP